MSVVYAFNLYRTTSLAGACRFARAASHLADAGCFEALAVCEVWTVGQNQTTIELPGKEQWKTMSQHSDRGYDTSPVENGTASRADTASAAKTSQRAASYDRDVQIAAARLRLVTDSQLGLETPDWVEELAASRRISGDLTAGHRDF